MFDFKKVCDVADCLASLSGEEFTRSAISRYYYSIFCCARLYLILVMGEDIFRGRENIHRKVSDRLIKSKDLTESSIGYLLEDLRYLRNLADYDWYEKDSSFFTEKLDLASSEARIGLEQIEALRNSPPLEL
ncbi:hypothetical protein [Methanobrevibacter sp.]|uniref:hypothetical protein n=1 Tax=Methanobrevibacter sp. TaxID=66852 RepID=UPI0038901A37